MEADSFSWQTRSRTPTRSGGRSGGGRRHTLRGAPNDEGVPAASGESFTSAPSGTAWHSDGSEEPAQGRRRAGASSWLPPRLGGRLHGGHLPDFRRICKTFRARNTASANDPPKPTRRRVVVDRHLLLRPARTPGSGLAPRAGRRDGPCAQHLVHLRVRSAPRSPEASLPVRCNRLLDAGQPRGSSRPSSCAPSTAALPAAGDRGPAATAPGRRPARVARRGGRCRGRITRAPRHPTP